MYDGDTDPAINSFQAQNWTSHLGVEEKEAWRPWTLDGGRKNVGFVTRYKGDFDYVTIRGSGHTVPLYRPVSAFEMMKRWIENKPLKGLGLGEKKEIVREKGDRLNQVEVDIM